MKSEHVHVNKWPGLKFSTSLHGRGIVNGFKDKVGFPKIMKNFKGKIAVQSTGNKDLR